MSTDSTMKRDKSMEQLVEKFLDGATSNSEEKALYDYFASGKVARRLEKYRAMFLWYAGGMTTPMPDAEVRAPFKRFADRLSWRAVAGVAAAALLLVTAVIGIFQHRKTELLYATYEGSYIVRNGKKITDLKRILPDLRRIENDAKALGSRHKGIGRLSPSEVFKMMDDANKDNKNRPTI